jgi:hypothetical protein
MFLGLRKQEARMTEPDSDRTPEDVSGAEDATAAAGVGTPEIGTPDVGTPDDARSRRESAKMSACKNALSPLMREVTATHLFVWNVSGGGTLDVTQQIRTVVRILDTNLDEATSMLQSASNQFDNAVRRWQSQVQQSEQKLKKGGSAGKLNQTKAKHNAVKTRLGPVQSLFRTATQALRTAGL